MNINIETAWNYLIEEFIKSLTKNTRNQYKNVFKANDFDSCVLKRFPYYVILLIAEKRTDELIKLIGIASKSVCSFDVQKKSKKTYNRAFIAFLERLLTSKSKKNTNILCEIIKRTVEANNACGSAFLNDEENEMLEKEISNNDVFLHNRLHQKFKSRLRRQDRTSGDKIWLPLSFIAKIFRKENCNRFSKWLDNLVEDIYVHYIDDDEKIKSVQFKNTEIFLDFKKRDDTYDVFVVWSSDGKAKRAYTPTGNGNEKIPMTVKDISQIDIDHIKPIDQTLRDLEEKDKLPGLKFVSDKYKQMLDDSSQKDADESNVEKEALEYLAENVSVDGLYKELELIRKDGLLRLMSSSYNERKSNSTIYDSIIKTQDGRYVGLLGEAIMDDNNNHLYLYQDLSECNITRATIQKPTGRKQAISKALIDFI